MKIDAIIYPHVFTDDGKRLEIKQFINQPRIGDLVQTNLGNYESIPQGDSSDCPSGVCPIK